MTDKNRTSESPGFGVHANHLWLTHAGRGGAPAN